jgi:hypothetical protein
MLTANDKYYLISEVNSIRDSNYNIYNENGRLHQTVWKNLECLSKKFSVRGWKSRRKFTTSLKQSPKEATEGKRKQI